jgi:hypothetical protein
LRLFICTQFKIRSLTMKEAKEEQQFIIYFHIRTHLSVLSVFFSSITLASNICFQDKYGSILIDDIPLWYTKSRKEAQKVPMCLCYCTYWPLFIPLPQLPSGLISHLSHTSAQVLWSQLTLWRLTCIKIIYNI